MNNSPRPVARLTSPGELVGVLPVLCGFVPTESLVVIALQGSPPQVSVTMRLDLPEPRDERAAARDVVRRLVVQRADAVLLAVCTDETDGDNGLPRASLVRLVSRRAEQRGLPVREALLVRGGRWWSYLCDDDGCCPQRGTPVEPSRDVELVRVAAAYEGRNVLGSRGDLVAEIEAPRGVDARVAASRLDSADGQRRRRLDREGRVRVGRDALRLWRTLLERAAEPPLELAPDAAALLAVSLTDVLVRDEVLTATLDDDAALLALLLELARVTVPPWDAPVCTLLAWVAYARGDGALANVALDRALAAEPDYALAQLARATLDGGVRPGEVRQTLTETRAALRAQHPWTAPRPALTTVSAPPTGQGRSAS